MKSTFGVPTSVDWTAAATELDGAVSKEVSREVVNGSTGRGNLHSQVPLSAESDTIDWSIGLGIVEASGQQTLPWWRS
jgi:hypothetical protein